MVNASEMSLVNFDLKPKCLHCNSNTFEGECIFHIRCSQETLLNPQQF